MEQLTIQLEILWPAFIAGLLILATHIPLGREVLERGIIFLDLAIAQIAGLGVVAANTIWLNESGGHEIPQNLVAIVAAIIGSLGLYSLHRLETKVQEAIIGISFILAATGSLLLLAADPHGGERIKEILVGQILWFQAADLLPLAFAYAAVLATWFLLRDKLGNWLFYPLFAVTITLSTQVVGVYLVFASLIIPSLATLRKQKPFINSFLIGTIAYAAGLVVSALFDLPAGATIVWSLALVGLTHFLLSSIRSKKHNE